MEGRHQRFFFQKRTFTLICCALRSSGCDIFRVICRLDDNCRPVVYPIQVVGHSGVDAVVSWSGTPLTPADNPQQEDGLLVLCHQGSATVTFTRVLSALDVPSTKHILGEHHTAVLYTLLCPNPWDFQLPQEVRGGPVFTPPAPTAHRV